MTARIAVIGGGISGLAAAHRVRELAPNSDVVVLEAGERVGGLLRTERRDGFVIEHGPDSILTQKPWAQRLAERLGLSDQMIGTHPDQHGAYVVCRGRLERIPEGFSLMAPTQWQPTLASPILSARGKARLLLEPLIAADPPHDDESLASFVTRRMGREVLERLAQPLVGGIYGSDPAQLSLHATMPRFVQMERDHGSVVRGLQQSPHTETAGVRYGMFFSFRDGMQTFTDTLGRRLDSQIRLRCAVERIEMIARGYRLHAAGYDVGEYDAVIIATPAAAAARLFASVDAPITQSLSAITHSSTATVSYAWKRDEIPHALDAYGFVVPHVEQRRLMACTWSSQKWQSRAPAGYALIRVFFGGHGDPGVVDRSDEELIRVGLIELRALMGIEAKPTFGRVARQHFAMPQYTLGHLKRASAIDALVQSHPGLALAGTALHGVGIPDAVREGEQAAAPWCHERDPSWYSVTGVCMGFLQKGVPLMSSSVEDPRPASEAAYSVEDRSLLLPAYKRFLVEPLVRFVPASVHPNTITHIGHLASLCAAACIVINPPTSGPRFAVAALLVQVYCWTDNADGAHARRTGQTSKYGEFLDHGLDSLTALYVILVTSAMLGLPAFWWVALAALAPGAAAIIYWEQAHAGVMRLALLNQVEGMLVLAAALLGTAYLGTDIWLTFEIFGVNGQTGLLVWTLATVIFGALRAIVRVTSITPALGLTVVAPTAALLSIVGAAGVGAVSTTAGIAASAAVGVYWSTHMLALRFGRGTQFETLAFASTAGAFALLSALAKTAHAPPTTVSLGAVVTCVAAFTAMLATDVAFVRARLLP
jgi:oxygen-dependent protoporphyrinogen oxidase